MSEAPIPSDELLVSQLSWLRRLASRLVADEDLAEEVVQETMALALEHPPQEPDRIRGWLRRVARNLFHEKLRQGAGRRARERSVARTEETPGMDELTERVHLQRRIADALLGLDEPSRRVLLLRFYEDVPPREIARRLDVPVTTVKSRIQRALQKLRSRLDDDYDGDRRSWALILVPWVGDLTPAAAPVSTTIWRITMGAKSWMAAGAIAIAGAWVWMADQGGGGGAVELAGVAAPRTEEPRPAAPGVAAAETAARARVEAEEERASDASPAPEPATAAETSLSPVIGRALDAEGRAAAGVAVRLRDEGEPVITAADGTFVLETARPTARIEVADPRYVELRLGPPTLTIEGRVVAEDGRPLPGGRIWVGDPSIFGVLGTIPLGREALMAGAPLPEEALDSLAEVASASPEEAQTFGSARPAFTPSAIVAWVETDADGRFELTGLEDRAYTLHVLDRELHWGTVAEGVRGGARGVRIVVPAAGVYPTLAGRVVTDRGDPVPGVAVTPWITAFHATTEVEGGMSDVTRFFLGRAATTDADGRFELVDVPVRDIQFHLVSDDITPSYASVDQVRDPGDFVIEVLARVHLEVVVDPGEGAPTSIRVSDAEGRRVKLLEMRADGYSNYDEFPLTDGRTGVLTLTSDAATLELLRDGEVLESIPIHPRPGEVTTIRR